MEFHIHSANIESALGSREFEEIQNILNNLII